MLLFYCACCLYYYFCPTWLALVFCLAQLFSSLFGCFCIFFFGFYRSALCFFLVFVCEVQLFLWEIPDVTKFLRNLIINNYSRKRLAFYEFTFSTIWVFRICQFMITSARYGSLNIWFLRVDDSYKGHDDFYFFLEKLFNFVQAHIFAVWILISF